jgi:hypothetical protein
MTGVRILQGRRGDETLFAAIDPGARYCEAKVSELRFSAMLTPFTNQSAAETALIEAGALIEEGSQ